MSIKPPQNLSRRITAAAIRRAVASSTAIETGQSIAQIELKLSRRTKSKGTVHVGLAKAKSA